MKKFEYLEINIHENENRIDILDTNGQYGWELINISKEKTETVHDGTKLANGKLCEFDENYYNRMFQTYLFKREVE